MANKKHNVLDNNKIIENGGCALKKDVAYAPKSNKKGCIFKLQPLELIHASLKSIANLTADS